MTPGELASSIAALNDNALSLIAIYLSVLSGYIIAAYMVGENLSRFQLFFINSLFVIFSLLLTVGAFQIFQLVAEIQAEYAGLIPEFVATRFVLTTLIIQLIAIGGALFFMHDRRKNKSG